jgi:protein-S-isoprenylcysteine O-methyltransferase Ste14
MGDPLVVRSGGLFLGAAVVGGLWVWRKPNRRWAAAALLGTAWCVWSLLALHLVAGEVGWWSYRAEGGLLLGMPVDLLLGWAVLWGAVPILAFPWGRALVPFVVFFWADLIMMPAAAPVIVLGTTWVVGEFLGLAVCLVPGFLLARWTFQDRHLRARAFLQALTFVALTLWFLPTAVMDAMGGSWARLLTLPGPVLGVALQVLTVPGVMALAAVWEFVVRGNGTPLPYDAPRRLVTTGPYAFVANPMQVGMTLILLGLGGLLRNGWIVAAAAVGVVFGSGIAAWHEDIQLSGRFGSAWHRYRSVTRRWVPRLRPWLASIPLDERPTPARLYIAATCEPCDRLGLWISKRRPVGLELRAAEEYDGPPLRRMTYDPRDGSRPEAGVAALGRALEHLHLGWALVGWAIRLPPVRPIVQLVADAVGAGPRELAPRRARERG